MINILVVDDNPMTREFLSTLLNYHGYKITTAGDGVEALGKIDDNIPDVVITDLLMPTMDGYEFVEKLRGKAATKNIRVIIYTATYALNEATLLAKSCGALAVISKPAEAAIILETIRQTLDKPEPLATSSDSNILVFESKPTHTLQEASKEIIPPGKLASLIELPVELIAERNPERMLQIACLGIRKVLDGYFCALGIVNKEKSNLEYYFTVTEGSGSKIEADHLPNLTKGVLQELIETKQMIDKDTLTKKEKAWLMLDQNIDVVRFIALPFKTENDFYGFIYLLQRRGEKEISKEELCMLNSLVRQSAMLYESNHMYSILQRHAVNLQLEVSLQKKTSSVGVQGESLFRQFAENVSDVFWVMTPDLNFSYVTPSFERVWGQSIDDLYRNPNVWLDEVDYQDRDRVKHTYEKFISGKKNLSLEYKIVRPDNSLRYIYDRGFPIVDEKGKLKHVIGIATDITERKKTEKRFETHYIITQTLAEADTLKEAAPKILRVLAESFGWKYAALWMKERGTNKLNCVSLWTPRSPKGEYSGKTEQKFTFESGDGLPGKVLKEKRPIWIADIKKDKRFDKDRTLTRDEVHGACGFPVISGQEVLGVIEFFSDKVVFLDEPLFKMMTSIGIQLGLYTTKKHTEAQLERMAHYDVLTGLVNRSALFSIIKEGIREARQKNGLLAVLFIDLDGFKNINDEYSHEVGDDFLKIVGERLRARVRKPDTVARLGGDEFVIILSNLTKVETASAVAQKILEIIARPFIVKNHEFLISASIGISIFPNDGADVQSLLSKADVSMYQAKEAGGNNYQFCTSELTQLAHEKEILESELRMAIEKEELVLLYQPIYDLRINKIIGVEALLYWNRDGAVLSPKEFLPLAEETGLIVPMGDWVLKTACTQIKAWQEKNINLSISINLSSQQLMVGELMDSIVETLNETKLDPKLLEIEITEAMLVRNMEASVSLIRALKAMKIQVSIDDFGTGYSSLMYLKQFRVDKLKIDQSFIKGIPKNKDDIAIAKVVIALGHTLGMKVVAEGVEGKEQLDFLIQAGCDEIQGYLLSKPLPAQKLTPFLQMPPTLI